MPACPTLKFRKELSLTILQLHAVLNHREHVVAIPSLAILLLRRRTPRALDGPVASTNHQHGDISLAHAVETSSLRRLRGSAEGLGPNRRVTQRRDRGFHGVAIRLEAGNHGTNEDLQWLKLQGGRRLIKATWIAV